MNWSALIRQFHRWVSIIFVLVVAGIFAALGRGKQPDVRYFHIHEHDRIDEAQLADWMKQASRLPGEKM